MTACHFELDEPQPYGEFGGIAFRRHSGHFTFSPPGDGARVTVDCELVAPEKPSLGAPAVVVEAAHFASHRPLGRDVYLRDGFLFGSGFRHGWIDDKRPEALAAFARCLRAAPPAELGEPKAIYGVGFSATADLLLAALEGHDGPALFDVALPATSARPFVPGAGDGPVLRLNSESDFLALLDSEGGETPIPRPGAPLRWYVATGGPHIPDTPATAGVMLPGCSETPAGSTPLDWTPIARALVQAGDRWVRESVVPPPSRLLNLNRGGEVVRDAVGHALGGVRLPMLDLSRDLSTGPRPAPGIPEADFRARREPSACSHLGDFESIRRIGDRTFFADAASYLEAFRRSTARLVTEGLLLETEAKSLITRAGTAADGGQTLTQAYARGSRPHRATLREAS